MTVTPLASNTLDVHTKLYSASDPDELTFPEATFPDCATQRHGLKPIEYARSAGCSISHNAKSAFLPSQHRIRYPMVASTSAIFWCTNCTALSGRIITLNSTI